ncbi:MAG: periplasmic heavy metal sensor, partial [Gammaproteobacteria bacterium]|nr:periplasmic heavy metal sensor [Gammaproteobacteria bacterium]
MNNRLRNGLIIALGISVALNLLLIGVGIGHTFHQPPPMMRINPMLGLSHFTHELSAERRRELAQTLRAFREASRPAFGEMRELQHQLREEIR